MILATNSSAKGPSWMFSFWFSEQPQFPISNYYKVYLLDNLSSKKLIQAV